MNAKKCDRCGEFYIEACGVEKRPARRGQRIFEAKLYGANMNLLDMYELCADCSVKLIRFLENKEARHENDVIRVRP